MTIKNAHGTIKDIQWDETNAKYDTLNVDFPSNSGHGRTKSSWLNIVEYHIDEMNGVITGTSEEFQEAIQKTFEYYSREHRDDRRW